MNAENTQAEAAIEALSAGFFGCFDDGLFRKDNPHKPFTIEYQAWDEGWQDAFRVAKAKGD